MWHGKQNDKRDPEEMEKGSPNGIGDLLRIVFNTHSEIEQLQESGLIHGRLRVSSG